MENATKQINVHLPVQIYEKLRAESFHTRRSMSALVRELLSKHQEDNCESGEHHLGDGGHREQG